MSDKYAVIQAHRPDFPVTLMCRVLDVSCAGFYASRTRVASARAHEEEQLRVVVRSAFAQARKHYGAPRITAQLRSRGVPVAKKRVARLMREDGLVARRKRRFVVTTDSGHTQPIAPNTLARDFAIGPTRTLNTVWVSDVTFVPTAMGWLYLAIVLDLASRRVVGWATSAWNDTALVLLALQRAIASRQPPPGWLHHSDRGSPYASAAYRACVEAHGGTMSMSRTGNCWDNAVAESFFATVEWELLEDTHFSTHGAATRGLTDFIDGWYNVDRLHSALDYKTPVDFEQELLRTPRTA